MTNPRYEDVVACFCGHSLFDHDNYGPCAECAADNARCEVFKGCLVIPAAPVPDTGAEP